MDKLAPARHILQRLGKYKLAAIRHSDVAALHRKVSESSPIATNRVVALLSKMYAIAIKDHRTLQQA